jgi:hypothetical protein
MAVIIGLRRAEARSAPAQTRLLTSSGQINSVMPRHARRTSDGDGNVICLHARGAVPRRKLGLGRCGTTGDSPVKDLREYESAPESDDDYRFRMRINLLAAVVVITLIATGSWMLNALANATQDSQTWKQLPAQQATR